MIIGFIGFGKVSRNLVNIINSKDIKFVTSAENRSEETVEMINDSNVQALDTFKDVAMQSDILISANSPKTALAVAEEYGKYVKGIYLDLNNISPDTTSKIEEYVGNMVDGAIIGKIDSTNPTLYVSRMSLFGSYARGEADKESDVDILIDCGNGKIKSLLPYFAFVYDLEDEFFDILALTEGDDFKEKSLSRINNTLRNSKRKSEELEEIINYFNENDLTMVKAALKKLSR